MNFLPKICYELLFSLDKTAMMCYIFVGGAMRTDRLLTAEDVAKILNYSPLTVYEKARNGEIPSIIIGRRTRRFRLSDIEALINNSAPAGHKNTISAQK
jgi:excisionase family DNA binding protein